MTDAALGPQHLSSGVDSEPVCVPPQLLNKCHQEEKFFLGKIMFSVFHSGFLLGQCTFSKTSKLLKENKQFLNKPVLNPDIQVMYLQKTWSLSTEWNFCSLTPKHGVGLHCRCLYDIWCGKYETLGMLWFKRQVELWIVCKSGHLSCHIKPTHLSCSQALKDPFSVCFKIFFSHTQ